MSSDTIADETDIYEGLPNFQFDEALKKLEEDKAHLHNKVEELGAQLEVMKKENEKLAAKVRVLGKNISCLYKTARRELERKEQIIADIRKERDGLLVLHGLESAKLNSMRRPNRKQLTPTKKVRNGGIRKLNESKEGSDVRKDGDVKPSLVDYKKSSSCIAVRSGKQKTSETWKVSVTPEVVVVHDSESSDEGLTEKKSTNQPEIRESRPIDIGSEPGNEALPGKQPSGEREREDSLAVNFVGEPNVDYSDCPKSPDEPETKKSQSDNLIGTSEMMVSQDTPASPPLNSRNVEVTTPAKDKVSVHMSSEDCGFGRRRIRRVVRPSVVTPVAAKSGSLGAEELGGLKRPLEETCDVSQLAGWRKPQLLEIEDAKPTDPRMQKRRCMEKNSALRSEHQDGKSAASQHQDTCDSSPEQCEGKSISPSGTDVGDLLVLSYDACEMKDANSNAAGPSTVSQDLKSSGVSVLGQDSKTAKDNSDVLAEKRSADTVTELDSDIVKHYGRSFGISCFGDDGSDELVESGRTPNVFHQSKMEVSSKSSARRLNAPNQRSSSSLHKVVENCIPDGINENGHGNVSLRSLHMPSSARESSSSPRHSPVGRTTDDESMSRRSWDRERVTDHSRTNEVREPSRREKCSASDDGSYRRAHHGRSCVDDDKELGTRLGRSREAGRRDFGRGWESGRNGEHHRNSERGRDYERERSRDRDSCRSRDRCRDYDRCRDHYRCRDHDRSREDDRCRDYDRRRGSERLRYSGKGRDSCRARSRDRGSDLDRSRDSDRGRDSNRGSRDSNRSRDLSRSRSRDRSSGKERDMVERRVHEEGRQSSGGSSKRVVGNMGGEKDLRDKLNKKSSPCEKRVGGEKRERNGYLDLDRPAEDEDEGERNNRWCERKSSDRDSKQNESRRSNQSFTPEWD